MADDKKAPRVNPFKSTDFRYYFAVDRADFRRFHDHLADQPILVSYVYLTEKADRGGQFLAQLGEHKGPVMLDSGAFTNFTTPGTVRYEDWRDFYKSERERFAEAVMFDDIASRPGTMRYWRMAIEDGLDPLFVDHLYFDTHMEEVKKIWTERDKVCVSGFAKTLPGQRDPGRAGKEKLFESFQFGREVDTQVHMLAVGSLRKYMEGFDRIHSVDSAAWDKAAAYGRVLVFQMEDWAGFSVPVLKAFDHPGCRVSRSPMPPQIKREVWNATVAAHKLRGETIPNTAKIVSIHQIRKYVEAIKKFDPEKLREHKKSVEADFANPHRIKKVWLIDIPEGIEIPGDGRVPYFDASVASEMHDIIHRQMVSAVAAPPPRTPVFPVGAPDVVTKSKGPAFTYHFDVRPEEIAKVGEVDIAITFGDLERRGNVVHFPLKAVRKLVEAGRQVVLKGGETDDIDGFIALATAPETKGLFADIVAPISLRSINESLVAYSKCLDAGVPALFGHPGWMAVDDTTREIFKSRRAALYVADPTPEMPANPFGTLAYLTELGGVSLHVDGVNYVDTLPLEIVKSVSSGYWRTIHEAGKFAHFEYELVDGAAVPVLKVYGRPGRGVGRAAPSRVTSVAKGRVAAHRAEHGVSEGDAWVAYTVAALGAYAAAIGAVPPEARQVATFRAADGNAIAFAHREQLIVKEDADEAAGESTTTDLEELGMLDVRSYDVKERTDEQLRQDWAVVKNIWSATITHGENYTGYSKEEILTIAVQIVTEVKRRGPGVMVFDPDAMEDDEKDLWSAVLREVDPGEEITTKRLPSPTTSFDGMDRETLFAMHRELHAAADRVVAKSSHGWTWEEVVAVHGVLVEKLAASGCEHPEIGGPLDVASEMFVPTTKMFDSTTVMYVDELAQKPTELPLDPKRQSELEDLVQTTLDVLPADGKLTDEVLERLVLEFGPPGSWSHVAGSILGPKLRKAVTAYVNGLELADKLRLIDRYWARQDLGCQMGFRVYKSETIEKADGKGPLRYAVHMRYVGTEPTMEIRFEKRVGGPLSTWAFPFGSVDMPVASLEAADELVAKSAQPALTAGRVCGVVRKVDSPNGWLMLQGIVPPGGPGASRTDPAVYQLVESGEVKLLRVESDVIELQLVPDDAEVAQILTLRSLPLDHRVLADDGMVESVSKGFNDDSILEHVSAMCTHEGSPSWFAKMSVDAEATEVIERRESIASMPEGIRRIVKAKGGEAEEKRLVTGVVLEPEEFDAHNDTISEEEIEQAAHKFLARYNKENELGVMHEIFGNIGIDLVESYIAPADMEIGGEKVKKGSWIMTVKVLDDDLWSAVKAGKLTGFSIGGLATPIPA